MISSQTQHSIPDFDEMVEETSGDFAECGLKARSVIRIGRLAVVEGAILLGVLGAISVERLQRIRNRLAAWLTSC